MRPENKKGFLLLHMLVPIGPANPNRDDLGQPKSVNFAGSNRTRISSQALKHAWRASEIFAEVLNHQMGKRTRLLGERLESYMVENGVEEEKARDSARTIISAIGKLPGKKAKRPVRTEQLVFLSDEEAEKLYEVAKKVIEGEEIETPSPSSIFSQTPQALDIALFGRMMADPDKQRFKTYAAAKVSHAFTTHESHAQEDWYTAVDDLAKESEGEPRAGFLDVAQFSAGVFYICVCVDLELLDKNLAGNHAAAQCAVEALIRAATTTMPSGRQTSFASYARPSYILGEHTRSTPLNLGPAFLRPTKGKDPIEAAVRALEYWIAEHDRMYSDRSSERYTMGVGSTEGDLDGLVAFATNS